ncbi:MAG: 50S ribosomal protein L4 [Patescibacteria group bacterium]
MPTEKTSSKADKKTAKAPKPAKTARVAKPAKAAVGDLVIPMYNEEGSKVRDVSVPSEIFGRKPDQGLIHRLLLMQHGNRRQASAAHTLEKGEVRGGGRKPYAQKGTGRARQGSTRNPHMRGGGVAFGPRNTKNFTVTMNKKERRIALFSCLSVKAHENNIFGLESFTSAKPKTKTFAGVLSKLPTKKDVLMVLPSKNEVVEKSARNIPTVKTILVGYLNPHDLLKYEHVIFLGDAISKVSEIFLKK